MRFCSGLALLLVLCAANASAQEITLKSDSWSVQINPARLGAKTTGALISQPQDDLGPIEILKQSRSSLSWRFTNRPIRVDCDLADNQLSVEFSADAPTNIIWPVIRPPAIKHALVLPMFEGAYLPLDLVPSHQFLVSREDQNTTADLSMPFIGLACPDQTLTWILADPFNNSLSFKEDNSSIRTTVQHEFTPLDTRRQYRVIVRRGAASPIEPARQYRNWLIEQKQFVPMAKKIEQTPNAARLLGAAHAYIWGDGVSAEMLHALHDAGLDRMCLTLGDLEMANGKPEVAKLADELGYVLGPYDSYHSIHSPAQSDTWATAQFDNALFETGPIVRKDGTKKPGFQKKGFILSPLAARPYVEKRVGGMLKDTPFTSWFVDCDGFGEVFDDYSPAHRASQPEDAQARVDRLQWLAQARGLVVGSEGGSAYAAPAIHFAHGMLTPVIGWGDPDLKDRSSKYFLGGYWPPTGPAVFFKSVPCKPKYAEEFFDPRYRLPLYQAVFHDSVIATHHWSAASYKFSDQVQTVELLELLYNVPPLYHLNQTEWKKRQAKIKSHFEFFSPLHRELAGEPVTDFAWLTSDKLVQQTTFGEKARIIANFSDREFKQDDLTVPARSVVAVDPATRQIRSYSPSN